MYQNIEKIKEAGFTGFKTVTQLWNDISAVPNESGVYLILNPDCTKKEFSVKGVGGFFKGKDPNVSEHELHSNWVDNCHVLYIGKAGANNSSATLRKRLKQYLDFGKGKPVGHYGGRLIWQLKNHSKLIIAWKTTEEDAQTAEKELIHEFANFYGKLPFANLIY